MASLWSGNSTGAADVASAIPQIWAKMVLRDMKRAGFWGRFCGDEASGMPIIQKSELLNNPGDTVIIQVTGSLTGAGVTDEAVLAGHEEKLSTTELVAVPTYYRHGVLNKRRGAKKAIVDLRQEAQLRLAEWGEQKLDNLRFSQFTLSQGSKLHTSDSVNYTAKIRCAGATGTTNTKVTVDATKPLSVADIQQGALTLYSNVGKPMRVDGQDVWVLVAHPNTLYNLKRDSEYRDWVREAHIRGADNPFFKGATAMIDGVVIYAHPNVPSGTDGGAGGTTKYAKNLMFGAESFIEGLDENPSWDEEMFDYGAEFGVAYGFACEPRRALEKNSLQLLAPAVDV